MFKASQKDYPTPEIRLLKNSRTRYQASPWLIDHSIHLQYWPEFDFYWHVLGGGEVHPAWRDSGIQVGEIKVDTNSNKE
jgi:hypothetical protein